MGGNEGERQVLPVLTYPGVGSWSHAVTISQGYRMEDAIRRPERTARS